MHLGEFNPNKSVVQQYRLNLRFCTLSSCPHITPNPGKKGRIYWLSGPPGAGKSTACQLLGREEGFVYYEADAMMGFNNPFVPTDVDSPSVAHIRQKSLKVNKLSSKKRSYSTADLRYPMSCQMPT